MKLEILSGSKANPEKFRALQDTYHRNPNARLINRFVKLDRGTGTIDPGRARMPRGDRPAVDRRRRQRLPCLGKHGGAVGESRGRIFHGFDGTVHVVGMPRLMWHEARLTSESFQVLPPHLRVFGDAQR